LELQKILPQLSNTTTTSPTIKSKIFEEFSTIDQNMVKFKDFVYSVNTIETLDDVIGLIDQPQSYQYLDYNLGLAIEFNKTFTDPDLAVDPEVFRAYNFYLSNKSKLLQRFSYTFMDVLGEVGGLLSSLQVVFGLFFSVYAYRLHHATLVRERNQHLIFPYFFGIRCWLHEILQKIKVSC
jgi:hypothetical protein